MNTHTHTQTHAYLRVEPPCACACTHTHTQSHTHLSRLDLPVPAAQCLGSMASQEAPADLLIPLHQIAQAQRSERAGKRLMAQLIPSNLTRREGQEPGARKNHRRGQKPQEGPRTTGKTKGGATKEAETRSQ